MCCNDLDDLVTHMLSNCFVIVLGLQMPGAWSPLPSPSPRVVSRSTCEPQREKEMFLFPKSPTEGTLSSVLLVREEANPREAFHEALFLPRSPRDQRRKNSKKLPPKGSQPENSSQESSVL